MRGVIIFYLILGAFCLGMLVGAKMLELTMKGHSDRINERYIKHYYNEKNAEKH